MSFSAKRIEELCEASKEYPEKLRQVSEYMVALAAQRGRYMNFTVLDEIASVLEELTEALPVMLRERERMQTDLTDLTLENDSLKGCQDYQDLAAARAEVDAYKDAATARDRNEDALRAEVAELRGLLEEVGAPVAGIPWVVPNSWARKRDAALGRDA